MNIPGPYNTPPLAIQKILNQNELDEDSAARIPYTRHYFELPKIVCGNKVFVWPVGTEGFRRSGAATLGIHKYLGRNFVDVHVVHLDEARIEMSGSFPGRTSVKNMIDLINILVMAGTKYLYVPGVFANVQTVFPESYDFPHAADDRTHSIDYTVTFVRTSTGAKVDAKQIAMNPVNDSGPSKSSQGFSANINTQSERVVIVSDSMNTLRSISSFVYNDADKWRTLVDLNLDQLQALNSGSGGPKIQEMPDYLLVTMRLPIGMRLRY